MTLLKSSWTTRPLGDLLEVQNGFAFDSELFSEKSGTPLIRIRDLKDGIDTACRFNGPYDPRFVVKAGDYLIGMDGEFKCYKWRGVDALLNQRVCRLINFDIASIEPAFLFWGINAHLKKIEDETPYVTVKHLSSRKLLGVNFAFPPLHEQRRIVARIKECMERVEEIERLRAEAVSEAGSVFPSALARKFDELADHKRMTIGDLAIETRYGTSRKCSTSPRGTPILRIPNVIHGSVNFQDLKFCKLEPKELNNVRLKNGDLLFVRTNGSRELVGRCAIYHAEEPQREFGFASYLIRVRLDPSKVRARFLAYFLNSTHGRVELNKRRRTSAGQFNINSENLRTIELPIPSVKQQDSLIEEFIELETEIAKVKAESDAAMSDEDHLRDAILLKAFSGEM